MKMWAPEMRRHMPGGQSVAAVDGRLRRCVSADNADQTACHVDAAVIRR
jgi:hypothetical protein